MNRLMAFTLLAGLLASCSALQNVVAKPTVHVVAVSYRAVSFEEGQLDSRLKIRNPNGFALPVRKLVYNLKLNNREFINSSLSFDKDIPANGSIELHVPLRFRYSELFNTIQDIAQHHEVVFQFAGTLDIGPLPIPFSKAGKFSLKF